VKRRRVLAARSPFAESGFTLLEALIALALTGVLLGMLTTVTGHWMANWRTGFGRVQNADLLGLGVDRIAADLAAAEYTSLEGDARFFFDGTESSVTFVRSAIGPNAVAGLEIVRLGEIDDARGRVLVRSRAPFALVTARAVGDGAVEFTNPIVLVRPPYRVSFAFAGRDRIWKETWVDVKQMPSAVRVTVRNDVTGVILPVSTAVSINVNAPAACVTGAPAGCDSQ
jgi:general secretion pathway protein J